MYATVGDTLRPGCRRSQGLLQFDQSYRRDDELLAITTERMGGLVTLLEMAFAGGTGMVWSPLKVPLDQKLRAIVQLREATRRLSSRRRRPGAEGGVSRVGQLRDDNKVRVVDGGGQVLLEKDRFALRDAWSRRLHAVAAGRRNLCRRAGARIDPQDTGQSAVVPFEQKPHAPLAFGQAPLVARAGAPRVAILRDQGVNGQNEMAAAFTRAGFTAVDVHMSDVLLGQEDLSAFQGLAACGGFSYGDVLGAGGGWAKSILFNDTARDAFSAFSAGTDICPGGLQRVSDAVPVAGLDSRGGALSAVCPKPQRALPRAV